MCTLNMMKCRNASASFSFIDKNTTNSGCIKPGRAVIHKCLGCKFYVGARSDSCSCSEQTFGTKPSDQGVWALLLHGERLAMKEISAELSSVLIDMENYESHRDECVGFEIILFIM